MNLLAIFFSSILAGAIAVASTVLIDHLGGRIGGILATTPTTILFATIGMYSGSKMGTAAAAASEGVVGNSSRAPTTAMNVAAAAGGHGDELFITAQWSVPCGMLIDVLFLYAWRVFPPVIEEWARGRNSILCGVVPLAGGAVPGGASHQRRVVVNLFLIVASTLSLWLLLSLALSAIQSYGVFHYQTLGMGAYLLHWGFGLYGTHYAKTHPAPPTPMIGNAAATAPGGNNDEEREAGGEGVAVELKATEDMEAKAEDDGDDEKVVLDAPETDQTDGSEVERPAHSTRILLLRGSLAASVTAIASGIVAIGQPTLAGVASVFPAIFLTVMVSQYMTKHAPQKKMMKTNSKNRGTSNDDSSVRREEGDEEEENGERKQEERTADSPSTASCAVGPMMLGSVAVSTYALLSSWAIRHLGVVLGTVAAYLVSVLCVSLPIGMWLNKVTSLGMLKELFASTVSTVRGGSAGGG